MLCVVGNGTCAGVACLIQLHIFCVSFRKNLTSLHLKILISHDWGSCWDFWHLPCIYYVFRERWLCWCRLFSSLFHFFCLFRKKTWVTCTWKLSYLMIGAHVDIANICSLLLCVSENGGCAGVTERRQLHIFLRCVCWCSVFLMRLQATSLCQFRWFICTLVGI